MFEYTLKGSPGSERLCIWSPGADNFGLDVPFSFLAGKLSDDAQDYLRYLRAIYHASVMDFFGRVEVAAAVVEAELVPSFGESDVLENEDHWWKVLSNQESWSRTRDSLLLLIHAAANFQDDMRSIVKGLRRLGFIDKSARDALKRLDKGYSDSVTIITNKLKHEQGRLVPFYALNALGQEENSMQLLKMPGFRLVRFTTHGQDEFQEVVRRYGGPRLSASFMIYRLLGQASLYLQALRSAIYGNNEERWKFTIKPGRYLRSRSSPIDRAFVAFARLPIYYFDENNLEKDIELKVYLSEEDIGHVDSKIFGSLNCRPQSVLVRRLRVGGVAPHGPDLRTAYAAVGQGFGLCGWKEA